MKTKTIEYFLFLMVVYFTWQNIGYSQDLKNDLEAMYQTYADLNNFYAKIEIIVFEGALTNTPILTKKAIVKKKKEKYLYTIDNLTMLSNERCLLMVNDTQKSIVYTKQNKQNQRTTPIYSLISPQLDSLLNTYEEIRYDGLKPLGKHYIILSSKSIIQRTDMFLDNKTYLINQLIYEYNPKYYGKKQKVKVLFKAIDFAPKYNKNTFSEKRYIVSVGQKLKTSQAYKNYELVTVDEKNE